MLDNPLVHWKLLIYRKRKQQLYIQLALFAARIFQLQENSPHLFGSVILNCGSHKMKSLRMKKKTQTHTEGMKSIVKYDGGDFRSLLGAASLAFPFRLEGQQSQPPRDCSGVSSSSLVRKG